MRATLLAGLSGAAFAAGLALSGMTQPAKVVAFLDFFGHWDASLAFVMAGAVVTYSLLYRMILRRSAPIFALQYAIPERADLDVRLMVGAAVFGAGWGLAGYCPGPALVSLGALAPEAVIFGAGMLGGMLVHRAVERLRTAAVAPGAEAAKGTS